MPSDRQDAIDACHALAAGARTNAERAYWLALTPRGRRLLGEEAVA